MSLEVIDSNSFGVDSTKQPCFGSTSEVTCIPIFNACKHRPRQGWSTPLVDCQVDARDRFEYYEVKFF